MFSSLSSFTLIALSLPFAANAAVHHRSNHHQQVASRARSELVSRDFSNARWSFYDVGMGACGKVNVASDYIVALNSAQFGGGYPGPHCFQTITMNYNGKTAQATIMDECPGCPEGGLDLSRGLFTHFASEDTGIIYGEWSFNDGSGGGDSEPAKTTSKTVAPAPETTQKKSTTKEAPPTSTYTPPAPTTTSKTSSTESSTSKTLTSLSTSASPSTTSTITSTSTSTSSSVSTISPSAIVNPALAESSGTVDGPSNLNDMVQILVGMAGMVLDGERQP